MAATTLADALLVELRAAVPSDVAVFDSAVTGIPPMRYVVLFAGPGRLDQGDNVSAVNRDVRLLFQVTSVASRPDTTGSAAPLSRWLAQRVRDRLVGRRLEVDGLACGPIIHTLSNPPVVDEDIKDRPTVYAVDQFDLLADRL